MYLHDQVPIVIFHILEADIPQNASIVDQYVDSAEVVDSSLDYALTVHDIVVVGYGLAAGLSDLVDDLVGHLDVCR